MAKATTTCRLRLQSVRRPTDCFSNYHSLNSGPPFFLCTIFFGASVSFSYLCTIFVGASVSSTFFFLFALEVFDMLY